MTINADIVNRALQSIGTRTTVTAAELVAQSSNEAIQANLILTAYRDKLLRMAPWDCATNFNNLVYITSTPGTPENQTAGTALWQKGQPPPPWAYEYQYPVDCLRALFIVPQSQAGSGGVPITTAVTGSGSQLWTGPPVKFKVALDQFWMASNIAVAAGGSGYLAGDYVTLAGTPAGVVPIGAPALVRVSTLGGGNSIATVTRISQLPGTVLLMGSYFTKPTNPVAQGSTTGSGTGATFNLTIDPDQYNQRVILTNQEFALLAYIKQVTDPNVMDELFIEAWIKTVGAGMTMSLTGDKDLANRLIVSANNDIMEARKADGNEGLTVNDVTPDWIRTRGSNFSNNLIGPYSNFDWGPCWPLY